MAYMRTPTPAGAWGRPKPLGTFQRPDYLSYEIKDNQATKRVLDMTFTLQDEYVPKRGPPRQITLTRDDLIGIARAWHAAEPDHD